MVYKDPGYFDKAEAILQNEIYKAFPNTSLRKRYVKFNGILSKHRLYCEYDTFEIDQSVVDKVNSLIRSHDDWVVSVAKSLKQV